jgi:sugar lactone lactonase YvrE
MTGNAIYAGLLDPCGLVYDASGNLFICDIGISLVVKVNANTGIVQIVAGSRSDGISGGDGFAGDGGHAHRASLKFPFGVAIDKSGNLFIADTYNNRIRRVDLRTGMITTVVGSGETGSCCGGFSGDGGPATSATLNLPRGVTFDAAGNMFIADSGNHRIRKVNGPFL